MSVEPWAIRSKPEYQKLQYDPLSRWNLLVAEGDGLIGLINLHNETKQMSATATTCLYTGSDVEKAYAQSYFNNNRCAKLGRFEDADALLAALPATLEKCHMGTRLYICGSEAFLWKVSQIAGDFGMHTSEVSMELFGSLARRVYCPHCKTTTEGVTTDIFECEGCRLSLTHVDHFSRVMGAFLGFRADAEDPGNVPERKELFA